MGLTTVSPSCRTIRCGNCHISKSMSSRMMSSRILTVHRRPTMTIIRSLVRIRQSSDWIYYSFSSPLVCDSCDYVKATRKPIQKESTAFWLTFSTTKPTLIPGGCSLQPCVKGSTPVTTSRKAPKNASQHNTTRRSTIELPPARVSSPRTPSPLAPQNFRLWG